MELSEMIKIMQHYADGGEVECSVKGEDNWITLSSYYWNWYTTNYRIKEQKPKVTIEKWLCTANQGYFAVIETSNIDEYISQKS